MSGDLPAEIVTQILERLPAKSLLCFRSVCKSWNSLITSPRFIADYGRRSAAASSSILLRRYDRTRCRELITVYRDGRSFLAEDQEIASPFHAYDIYYLIGAGNGLVCLSDRIPNYVRIVLWNPSIRTLYQLPIPRFMGSDEAHSNVVAFGFDFGTNQFKVLRLVYIIGMNYDYKMPPEVEIFVIGSERWRKVDATDVPYIIPESSRQAVLHGAIHWIGYKQDHVVVIVVFDVQEEIFREIEIPTSIKYPNLNRLSVALHGELLCLFENDPWLENTKLSGVCFVWVMMRYRAVESWTKQFTVDMRDMGGLKRVLGFRKHGKILVVNGNDELVSYDPSNWRIEQHGLHGIAKSSEAIPYTESLVLLETATGSARQVGSSGSMRS